VQYGEYVWKAVHGEPGPVDDHARVGVREFIARFPATIELSFCAMLSHS